MLPLTQDHERNGIIKMSIFWEVAPHSIIEIYRCFTVLTLFIISTMTAAVSAYEMSASFYVIPRRIIRDDRYLHTSHHENLTSDNGITNISYYLWSSGLLRRLVFWLCANLAEERTAFIIIGFALGDRRHASRFEKQTRRYLSTIWHGERRVC